MTILKLAHGVFTFEPSLQKTKHRAACCITKRSKFGCLVSPPRRHTYQPPAYVRAQGAASTYEYITRQQPFSMTRAAETSRGNYNTSCHQKKLLMASQSHAPAPLSALSTLHPPPSSSHAPLRASCCRSYSTEYCTAAHTAEPLPKLKHKGTTISFMVWYFKS